MRYLFLFMLIGCSSSDVVFTRTIQSCDNSTTEKRAQFTLECIENANPKSDEEPEDWIMICKTMAEATYCKNTPGFQHFMNPGGFMSSNYWTSIFSCDQAKTDAEKAVCP